MMIQPLLKAHLEPLARRRRQAVLWSNLALALTLTSVFCVGLMALQRWSGWSSILALPLGVTVGVACAVFVALRFRRQTIDVGSVVQAIESAHPELEGRLLTAIQQLPESDGELNVLQQKLIGEVLAHNARNNWPALFPASRLALARASCLCALGLFALSLYGLRIPGAHNMLFVANDELNVSVSPGDVSLERGSSLVVVARFAKGLPPRIELVLDPPMQGVQRMPLVKSLADPLFGVTIQELNSNVLYHLEYSGKRTRDFKATVFDYPRLERSDADLTFPPYTGLGGKHIDNTRRLSAVEGSHAHVTLQLNKVVAQASLVCRDTNRTTIRLGVETNRPLAVLTNFLFETTKTYELQLVDSDGRTNKVPAQFVFNVLKNQTPELKIASPPGDSRPSALEEISFDGTVWDDFGVRSYGLSCSVAGKELKTFELGKDVPARDKHAFHFVLRGEELGLKPDDLITWFAWADDIGPNGQVRRTTGDLYFAEVRPFDEIFREGQNMADGDQQQQMGGGGGQADRVTELQKQIISATWNLLRREHPSAGSAPQPKPAPQTNSPASPGSERSSSLPKDGVDHLSRANLGPVYSQKTFATHNLMGQQDPSQPTRPGESRERNRRDPATQGAPRSLADDLGVVTDAQSDALEQTEAAKERQQEPNFAALWDAAAKQMERALDRLRAATNSSSELQQALAAEQAAYQALLKLQEREFSVTRNRNRQRGQSGRQQQMQRQLEQLDLSKAKDRYETERQARAPQTPERSEQLQVMNRLQELARRQQDINERLKELQTALQEAQTEKEREEIQRQLKRLQEDEQELLADADELKQRMERPENQSRMSDQRRQLEQARDDLAQASQAVQQGQPSQALASGTRAQQQLQQMREEMRQQNAGEFDKDLREMRNEARELAQRQEEIQQKMDAMNDPQRRTLSDEGAKKQSLDELSKQSERLTNLVARATQLSQQAEQAEPLMSRELYDTLRKFSQEELSTLKQFREELMNRGMVSRQLYDRLKETEQSGSRSLDLTAELLRQGMDQEAAVAQERAQSGIQDLKRGVERAAESVLGDEAQALRRARDELDALTAQLSKEIPGEAASQTNQPGQSTAGAGQPGSQGTNDSAQLAGQGTNGNQSAQNSDRQAGPGEPSELAGNQPGNQPGQNGSETDRNNPGTGTEPGSRQRGAAQAGNNRNGNTAPNGNDGRRGGGPLDVDFDRLFEGRGGYGGPITGEDFGPWSDRLREVEELVDAPRLRADVARARERARQMRQVYRRNQQKPDWAQVRLQVLKPLIEVREQLAEQLARRQPGENLVPIDRDPVPGRYSELVRRYYEELGKGQPPQPDSAPK